MGAPVSNAATRPFQGRGIVRLGFCAALAAIALATLAPGAAAADKARGTGTVQSSRLYTQPDAAATGGLQGALATPAKPAVGVFAMPVDDWQRVYRATLAADGRSFAFTGLPVGRYSLAVVYDDCFYEGLELLRDESTLAPGESREIEAAIMKSTPFFDTKQLHRVAGVGGDDGKARGVLQEVRTRPVTLQSAEVRSDIQVRSLKLVLLERAGRPGWALVHSRELVRQEVAAGQPKGLLQHAYSAKLQGIRVVDSVKDMGTIALP